MKILLIFFSLFFSFKTFAEIKDKEMLNAYNEGCLEEDPGPVTVGEQFLVCGCLTNEVSKVYTLEEILNDENWTEKQKFSKIVEYCITIFYDSR